MKIALVQCPAFGVDRPPLALAYLAAFLRKYGYKVNIFDLNISLYSKTEEKNKKLWEFEYVFQWIDMDCFVEGNLLQKIHFKSWAKEILDSNLDLDDQQIEIIFRYRKMKIEHQDFFSSYDFTEDKSNDDY